MRKAKMTIGTANPTMNRFLQGENINGQFQRIAVPELHRKVVPVAGKAILFLILVYFSAHRLDGVRAVTVGAWMRIAGFFITH